MSKDSLLLLVVFIKLVFILLQEARLVTATDDSPASKAASSAERRCPDDCQSAECTKECRQEQLTPNSYAPAGGRKTKREVDYHSDMIDRRDDLSWPSNDETDKHSREISVSKQLQKQQQSRNQSGIKLQQPQKQQQSSSLPLVHHRQPLSSFVIAVEAVIRTVKRNQLEALVVWEILGNPPVAPHNMTFFQLHWARNTCNLNRSLPHCDDADHYYHETVRSENLKGNYTMHNLTYNSRYWAEVELNGVKSHKVWLNTKGCRKFHKRSFGKCLDEVEGPSSQQAESTRKTEAPNVLNLRPNVSCLYFDVDKDTGHAWLEWSDVDPRHLFPSTAAPPTSASSKDELSRSSTSTNLPRISNSLKYSVMITYVSHNSARVQLHQASTNKFHLEIQPDIVYNVRVKTYDGEQDLVFNDLKLNISRSFSDPAECHVKLLGLKNSTGFLGLQSEPAVFIFCTLLFFFLVVAATVLILCLFSKCRRAHTKLLKKTLLAKNNSYKTAPGVMSSTLAKEEVQLVLSDEWELDAKEVTLGAEIGQGAFGLVMTGYYRNKQVAIKVLKGDVSPSHREELLREIELMKRIGPHNNIVSLIGACTLRDPIALIMEYMPFGNLQTFLQKCRIEGELRRTERGTEMSYSPLDQLTGAKEFWSLTATDLLSFARQIAVAMEFLTGKKYVHRDLAARNVLVSSNKIVKLCDFGLARIVHNGDHYCKLTNGRLPLKWMALESIRDRIFTAQSDVWSYGVLLWEVTTLGSTPYPDVALVDLYRMLSEGYRMEKPKNCSSELYSIMYQCWYEEPSKRPVFTTLRIRLESMLSQRGNYLDLELVDTSTMRIKRPPTPVQPIEFRHPSPRYQSRLTVAWRNSDRSQALECDSDAIWRTSDSNDYQEPRKTFRSSASSNLKATYWAAATTTTTTAADSDSNNDDDVFDQLV